jgi:hypothetical protein
MTLEDRVSRLEGALEQIDHRPGDLHQSIIGVREEIHSLRSETNSRCNTLTIMVAGSWVTLFAGITAPFFK